MKSSRFSPATGGRWISIFPSSLSSRSTALVSVPHGRTRDAGSFFEFFRDAFAAFVGVVSEEVHTDDCLYYDILTAYCIVMSCYLYQHTLRGLPVAVFFVVSVLLCICFDPPPSFV